MKIICIIFFLFLMMSIIPVALWAGCEPVAETPTDENGDTTPPSDEEDLEPPGDVLDFTAVPGDGSVQLSWTNPSDLDFVGVIIMYRTEGFPIDVNDGTLVYEGQEESCIHDGLTNGIEYYYTAFTFDDAHTPNYSAGQSASAIPRSPKYSQEMAKLLAPDDTVEDYFGCSVSISGEYAIVGAYGDDDIDTKAGAAYIYHWNGSEWVDQQKLKASDGAGVDYFGYSVSISGDYAVIGAIYEDNTNGIDAGSAYIFQRVGTEWVEQTKLTADDGADYDGFGCSVLIEEEYAIIGARGDDDKGTESGSAYVFRLNGTAWSQEHKFLASDGDESNNFGTSVSINGDYAIIGANQNDNTNGIDAGAAYIYHWNGTTWEETKLIADDGADYDNFGWSVSISGDYAIVGADTDDDNGQSSGSAYIYHYNAGKGKWEKQVKLSGNYYELFGRSVFIRGGYAVVGAPVYQDDEGSAYIYQWNGTTWELQQHIEGSSVVGEAQFGCSVSMSGDYVIVGARHDEEVDTESGSAYIYYWNGAVWEEKQKFIPRDEVVEDFFGFSVSIKGDNAIVGAYGDDDNGDFSGSACIFHWDGTEWVDQQKLTASDAASGDSFGGSASISGDYAIVGAHGDDDNGNSSGSAYIFHWNGTEWEQQQKLTASDGAVDDRFGCSVSISADYVIVGAYDDDDNGENSGSAYIFQRSGTTWVEQQKLTASDGAADDWFGSSVSISGDYAIVGADGDDHDNESNVGKAYIFRRDGSSWGDEKMLTANDGAADDRFGGSVSISGDYIIVGADRDDDKGSSSGSAYIFHWNGTEWEQQQKFTAGDGAADDWFGCSVSISGDYAIVGAWCDDDNGENSGSAYIFQRSGTTWVEQKKLIASDGADYDLFGRSVSISEDYAIVGADYDDDKGDKSGSAYIFK